MERKYLSFETKFGGKFWKLSWIKTTKKYLVQKWILKWDHKLKSFDLYEGTIWKAEQLSVDVSKFDISHQLGFRLRNIIFPESSFFHNIWQYLCIISIHRSLGAPTSSKRPFGLLDFVLFGLLAFRQRDWNKNWGIRTNEPTDKKISQTGQEKVFVFSFSYFI